MATISIRLIHSNIGRVRPYWWSFLYVRSCNFDINGYPAVLIHWGARLRHFQCELRDLLCESCGPGCGWLWCVSTTVKHSETFNWLWCAIQNHCETKKHIRHWQKPPLGQYSLAVLNLPENNRQARDLCNSCIDVCIDVCIDYERLVGGLEHFLFSHIFGIVIPIDFHIFQRGLFNHQPDKSCRKFFILLISILFLPPAGVTVQTWRPSSPGVKPRPIQKAETTEVTCKSDQIWWIGCC